MPGALTHYCFAFDNLLPSHKGFYRAVFVGAQGPDCFFAYGMKPWKKRANKEEVRSFGAYIHHIDVADLYLDFVRLAKDDDSGMLYAYIDGLLMHYALDRNVHPYVFYRSGFDENGCLNERYTVSHSVIEALIDRWCNNKKGHHKNLSRVLSVDKKWLMKISLLWSGAAKSGVISENTFFESAKDHAFSLAFINNRTGLKRRIVRLLGKNGRAYTMSMPRFLGKYKRKYDFANERKGKWLDPFKGTKRFESLDELLSEAKKDFLIGKEIVDRAFRGEDVASEFKAWTNNINHDGGEVGFKLSFCEGTVFEP